MFKLIILVLGLAIGFGGGVYWSVRNPEQAAKFNTEQEKRVLEARIAATKAVRDQLDAMATKKQQAASSSTPAGFASGFTNSKAVPDPDLAALRDDQDRKLQDLQKELDAVNAKKK